MSDAEILFERLGSVGLVTLNRPKALNALTHEMCVQLRSQLEVWRNDTHVTCVAVLGAGERAFCAGGDIRSLYESGKAGTPYARAFYRDEYLLDAAIKHYPKPYVALIRGIVMGGGVGISVHGTYRIADETTTFAMPETGIGLFPDVGGSYFLPRCPGEVGMYLALTGTRLKTADALYAGVATHIVPGYEHSALIDRLAGGAPPDTVIASLAGEVGRAPLADLRLEIDAAFSLESVEAVLSYLDAHGSDWARRTAAAIRGKSPTSTKLAFRQLREGRKLNFDDCMRMEFRMVNRVIDGHEFYEGVRATIIDKDNAPNWSPSELSAVDKADIDAYFAPLGSDELALSTN
jgi:enoyl-CoA hydratase